MGDRGHNRHGPKRGGGVLCPFRGALGICLTQCGLCRCLLPYQVASSSIQPFGLNVLHLSKVNFLVPRIYFVKLHGTHFNYVLACISDMLMYSNTGFARYHICHELLHIAFFSLLFSCLLFFFVFICVYVLYCYHELVNKALYIIYSSLIHHNNVGCHSMRDVWAERARQSPADTHG